MNNSITGCINKIYAAADKAKDYRTMQFFDWFVKEQEKKKKECQRPDSRNSNCSAAIPKGSTP